jgi:paraquat-inducible protein A
VEVFSIGVIVSLVKIAAMARVELGISFWAYLVFSILFLLTFSSLDRMTVWSAIERLRRSA